jgi:hypothetical protein
LRLGYPYIRVFISQSSHKVVCLFKKDFDMHLAIGTKSIASPHAFASQSVPNVATVDGSNSKKMQSIQKLLRQIYQNPATQVLRVDPLPAAPHKGYVIWTSDGQSYVLKTSPSSSTRLLRHEASSPAGEAHVLSQLSRLRIPIPVPLLLSTASDSNNAVSGPYLLRTYIPGISLSSMAHQLSAHERAQLDRNLGRFMRQAMSIQVNTFGAHRRIFSGEGYPDWRTAFHALLEAALRDAEDAVLTLPYDSIRHYVGQHMDSLEAVSSSCLVPLRSGTPNTVLVDPVQKKILGIVGWGDVVWGDAALSEVFESASDDFWSGFGGRQVLDIGDGQDDKRKMM